MIDPLAFLLQSPYGSACYSRVQVDGGDWEVAWLLREEAKNAKKLGKEPPVEFRAGLILQDNVFLIPALVRVGPVKPESIFETWLNVWQTGEVGPAILHDLATQERIAVQLYDRGPEPERSIQVFNSLHTFFSEAERIINEAPPWSMRAFDSAREVIYAQNPAIMDLWRKLK